MTPTRYGAPRRPWSTRRKLRLARTGIILFVIVLLVWQCTGDDDGEVTSEPPETTQPTVTEPPVTPTAVVAELAGTSLPKERYEAATTAVGDRVLVLGGIDRSKSSTDTIIAFDPGNATAGEVGKLPSKVHDAAAGSVGTTAYLFGGTSGRAVSDQVLAYPMGNTTATVAGKLPGPRTDAVATSDAATGVVYLVGGHDGTNPTNEVLATTDGTSFRTVAVLAEPVRFPAVAVQGTVIWVIGGIWKDKESAAIQRIDLSDGSAKVVAQLPKPVSHAMAFVLGDSVYLAGGRSGGGRLDDIRRLDPDTFTFSNVASLPSILSDAGVATVGQVVYLVGGQSPTPTAKIVKVSRM